MKNITFKINDTTYSIKNLIGKSIDDAGVVQLIEQVKAIDPTYLLHEPMEEDIQYDNDKWKVGDAFEESFTFEFLNGKLIYISFSLNPIDNKVIELSDDIRSFYSKEKLELNGYYSKRDGYYQRALDSNLVVGLIEDENQKERIKMISFGDYEIFSNEENLPNRYSEILTGLILDF